MDELGGGHVEAGALQDRFRAKTEVDVLRAVDEYGVEALQLDEVSRADRHAGTGHGAECPQDVDGGVVARKALVDVIGKRADLAEYDAGVLDRPVGVEELAAYDPDGRIDAERVDQVGQP